MKKLDSCPKADGYRMPAEFEEHAGTYMIWPERPDNWRLGAKPAQHVFTRVANAIGKYEPITMVVSSSQYANARNMLDPAVRVVEMSNDDSWMRDCGASFLINDKGELLGRPVLTACVDGYSSMCLGYYLGFSSGVHSLNKLLINICNIGASFYVFSSIIWIIICSSCST